VAAWLLASPQVNGVSNLGSGQARTFEDLARAVFSAAGPEDQQHYSGLAARRHARSESSTDDLRVRVPEAGYTAGFTPLEAGIEDYVRRYLATDTPYR
ncbi:MAG: ADP-glyceromanno-heptose 6-epimerase, partial [Phenylobacterium sp.]